MAKYIAKGMTEMCLMLQTPAGPWRVDFTGGLISGYGCAPASFSTDDRVLMRYIEQTDAFRLGRIIKT